MNRICPTCGFDFASEDAIPDGGPMPLEDDHEAVAMLYFCSEACRDDYVASGGD